MNYHHKLSLFTEDQIYDAEGAFFKVPARKKQQKPIFFERYETEPKVLEPPEVEEVSMEIFKPYPKISCMMKNIGYNFKRTSA